MVANSPPGGVALVCETEPTDHRSELITHVLDMVPSWLVSMIVHLVALVLLACIVQEQPLKERPPQVVATVDENADLDELAAADELVKPVDQGASELLPPDSMPVASTEMTLPTVGGSLDSVPAAAVELGDAGLELAPKSDLLSPVGSSAASSNPLAGRTANRSALVAAGGGNDASERAVAAGLKWLAEHQLPDGGWSFAHGLAPACHNQCRNPGALVQARVAATGLALLPFLGAGQTHKSGRYQKVVRSGLYFLINRMRVNSQGGSLMDIGNMYSHGIASIALCEAYAMTHDKGLYSPAQQAVNFICFAQDPQGGGWRYQPRQKGDTSVLGWQVMALKSGHMAYLRIPLATVKKAGEFLDYVQSNGGATYGYTDPMPGPAIMGTGDATTAIGLLCRMYLGWSHDHPALVKGVQWLARIGPDKSNLYYDYYATQVMRHWEGDEWKQWNAVMRDMLVNSQAAMGHEAGSWCVEGLDTCTIAGGRLYCTAMATMILEVYYRHLPIYGKQSTGDNFPSD